jgi:hypothetical protein
MKAKMGGKKACNQRGGMLQKRHAIFLEIDRQSVAKDIKKGIKAKKERKNSMQKKKD